MTMKNITAPAGYSAQAAIVRTTIGSGVPRRHFAHAATAMLAPMIGQAS